MKEVLNALSNWLVQSAPYAAAILFGFALKACA